MTPLTVYADVQNMALSVPSAERRRVAGLVEGNARVVVASMTAGEQVANLELSFELVEAQALALAALAGDPRALTTPGLARKLSATVAILFRVCLATGALQQLGSFDGGSGDDLGREQEAGGDEDPGD